MSCGCKKKKKVLAQPNSVKITEKNSPAKLTAEQAAIIEQLKKK